MTIGVIIVNYFTEELLRPLVRQVVGFPMVRQVVIFDNGSTQPLSFEEGAVRVMSAGSFRLILTMHIMFQRSQARDMLAMSCQDVARWRDSSSIWASISWLVLTKSLSQRHLNSANALRWSVRLLNRCFRPCI